MDQLSEKVIQAIANRVMKKMETGISLKQQLSSIDPPAGETSGRSEVSGGGSGIGAYIRAWRQ